VEHLKRAFKQEDIAIAYIYCNYIERETQTNANLIASLLQQLVQTKPTISDEIVSLYHRHTNKKKKRPTVTEWSNSLKLELEVRNFSRVFIVIDALDECSDITGFLTAIRKLQPSICLLVTSRHIPSIEHAFKMAARIEIRASDEDIRKYVEKRIMEDRLAKLVEPDPTLRETIVNSIVQSANGM
jgi:hypothetical protein